jgi:hypothetical protein
MPKARAPQRQPAASCDSPNGFSADDPRSLSAIQPSLQPRTRTCAPERDAPWCNLCAADLSPFKRFHLFRFEAAVFGDGISAVGPLPRLSVD